MREGMRNGDGGVQMGRVGEMNWVKCLEWESAIGNRGCLMIAVCIRLFGLSWLKSTEACVCGTTTRSRVMAL